MKFNIFFLAFLLFSVNCWAQSYLVSTAAGKSEPLDGVGTAAYFGGPWQVAVRDSIAYISDLGNSALRQMNLRTNEISTIVENQTSIAGLALSVGGDSLYFSTNGNIIRLYRVGSHQISTVDTVIDNQLDAMVCDKKGNLYLAGSFSHRILRRDSAGNYKTIAGKLNTEGFFDALDTNARFNRIASLIFSRTEDTLYISDRFNSRIRRLVRSTRLVSTMSINTIYGPRQLALNPRKDTLYIANSSGHTIYRHAIKANIGGHWCGAAGVAGYKDTTLALSRFNFPMGIGWSKYGFVCADNTNQRIRMISNSGKVTTIGGVGLVADGFGTESKFNLPIDVVKHPGKDTLYISDQATNAIRRYNLKTGEVSTLAGNGKQGKLDGIGQNATMTRPTGLAISRTGDTLFFCEPIINKIRMVNTKTAEVKWLAGSDTAGYVDKPQGKFARFSLPQDIALYGDTLFIADQANQRIRIYNKKTGAVTTFAGSTLGFKDSTRLQAKFNRPITIEMVGKRLFVGEDGGLRIRVIHMDTNWVRNWAGNGSFNNVDGYGSAAQFRGIKKMSYDPERGFLLVGGYLNEGYLRGVFVKQPFVGTFNSLTGFQDGLLGVAKFLGPLGSWSDTVNHRIFIADGGNNRIRIIQQLANQPPTAEVDSVVQVLEDAPLAAIDSFATQMTAGNGLLDSNQYWLFSVKSAPLPRLANEAVMFPDGRLFVQPAPDSNGVVDLRIRMRDSGGTLIFAKDTSIYYSRLEIIPVNDRPFFRSLGNDSAHAGSFRKKAFWVDSSSAGPWNEREQQLSYEITVDQPSWFTHFPEVRHDSLVYQSVSNMFGVVNAQIMTRDDGGTDHSGVDSSFVQTFQIFLFDPLGIETLKSGKMLVYPNPATDKVHFLNAPANASKVQWVNSLGKVVAEQSILGGSNTLEIPPSANGAMMLRFVGEKSAWVKIMVVR